MKPLRLLLLLALSPVLTNAADCHYFWTTDCFEIRDPRTRDITHHVLLSEPGCQQLETLPPEVFADEAEAAEEWQRLATERNFKSLHLIRRLPD